MIHSDRQQPAEEGASFCSECDPPLQEQYVQEVSTMRAIVDYFTQKRWTYAAYDKVCNNLRRDRGASKAMLIWGVILLFFTLVIFLSQIVDGNVGYAIGLLIAFGAPGAILLFLGVKKIDDHEQEYGTLLEEYQVLSAELIEHYQNFGPCPIPAQFTNPDILNLFYSQLITARATTIRDSIAQVVDPYLEEKTHSYLEGVKNATDEIDFQQGITTHFVIPTIFR